MELRRIVIGDRTDEFIVALCERTNNLARAMVLDEDFDATEHCKRYHKHWARLERRRWRLRDGRRGEGKEKLLDLVAAGDHDVAGDVVCLVKAVEDKWIVGLPNGRLLYLSPTLALDLSGESHMDAHW